MSDSKAESGGLDLQKINVKFGLEWQGEVDWDLLLAVFGRWRLEQGEEVIDLADYGHVPEGPSCVLVSKRYLFGIDFARGCGLGRVGGWAGLCYASRKNLSGDLAERLRAVARACLEKSKRLLAEPEVPASVALLCGEVDVVFNDRLRAPNTGGMDARVRPAVEELARRIAGGPFEIERDADPGRRLGYSVRAAGGDSLDIDRVLARLG